MSWNFPIFLIDIGCGVHQIYNPFTNQKPRIEKYPKLELTILNLIPNFPCPIDLDLGVVDIFLLSNMVMDWWCMHVRSCSNRTSQFIFHNFILLKTPPFPSGVGVFLIFFSLIWLTCPHQQLLGLYVLQTLVVLSLNFKAFSLFNLAPLIQYWLEGFKFSPFFRWVSFYLLQFLFSMFTYKKDFLIFMFKACTFFVFSISSFNAWFFIIGLVKD